MHRILGIGLFLIASLTANAQKNVSNDYAPQKVSDAPEFYEPVYHSTMVGAGFGNVMDTYLSPYSYKGGEVRVLRETKRKTKLMDSKVWAQSLINVNLSYLENPGGNVNEWAGGLRYSFNWLYDAYKLEFSESSNLEFSFGPGISGYLGGVYNTRNGNNPANVHADLMIDASAMAKYSFNLLHKDMSLEYQLSAPLFGVAYSPNYGQAYYEEFVLNNKDHNVCFAYVGNMPSWRHLLTLNIRLKRNLDLRVGYMGEFMQSTFNNLRYHQYSHNFLIGFTKTFYR